MQTISLTAPELVARSTGSCDTSVYRAYGLVPATNPALRRVSFPGIRKPGNVVLGRQGRKYEKDRPGNQMVEGLASRNQATQGAITADLVRYGNGDHMRSRFHRKVTLQSETGCPWN